MKRIFSLFVIVSIVLTFSACSGGIKGKEAKELINNFFDCIETKDYEAASEFLHPERPAELDVFFEGLEKEEGLDFSDIQIEEYTGFSSAYYDSTVDGSTYSLEMDILLNDKEIEMEIEIVKNDNGYGIYNLDIDT